MFKGINIRSKTDTGDPFALTDLCACHSSWAEDADSLGLSETDHADNYIHLTSLDHDGDADVLIVDRCTSTMELAVQYSAEGRLSAWGAVMAVRQESGRGQLRRHWVSEAGNLHVSYLLPQLQDVDPLWNRLLPLLIGWCIKKGLQSLGAQTVLKWPNDLVQLQNKTLHKISGLLLEDRGGNTVAGLGINLIMAPGRENLREGAAFPAGIIDFSKKTTGPLRLWLKLVKQIKKEYQALLDNSTPRMFTKMLSQELLWIGEDIVLHDGDGSRQVVFLGLEKDGGLRVLGSSGEEVIYSGSISKTISG